jgi:hypothetical protein
MKSTISFSEYSTAVSCLRKYQHLYIDMLPGDTSAALKFGSAIHSAIAGGFEGSDPVDIFEIFWESEKDSGLDFGRLGWEGHMTLGKTLMRKFSDMHRDKMEPIVYEKRIKATLPGGTVAEGTPDCLAVYGGKNVLFDFKTSNYPYDKEAAVCSLQLNLYSYLLECNGYRVDQLCFFVFKKQDGGIQKPIIVDYDRGKCLDILEDMEDYAYMLGNLEIYPKNPTNCIKGAFKCPFFKKCWDSKNE